MSGALESVSRKRLDRKRTSQCEPASPRAAAPATRLEALAVPRMIEEDPLAYPDSQLEALAVQRMVKEDPLAQPDHALARSQSRSA
eukprot:2101600-Prymnesium_polylepis.1